MMGWKGKLSALAPRYGKRSTTDGLFDKTKEELSGFYLIEARNLNDAIRAAGRIAATRIRRIEVRPNWDLRRHEPRSGR